jgi:hypothetical protein
MFKEALMPSPEKTGVDEKEFATQEILEKFNRLKELREKNPNDPEFMKMSHETYIGLEKLLSSRATVYKEISNLYYKHLNNGKILVVRREDPNRSLVLAMGGKLELSFDENVVAGDGEKYANCALWPYGGKTMAGMSNALKEGKSSAGSIVTVLAMAPDPETAEVSEPEGKTWNITDIDRTAVKSISGTINAKDLRFMVIRMPRKFFPPECLTEEEKNSASLEVFRGFDFNKI